MCQKYTKDFDFQLNVFLLLLLNALGIRNLIQFSDSSMQAFIQMILMWMSEGGE